MPEDEKFLSAEEILKVEFAYAAETAFQAHEDRARVTTFYFVSVGSLIASILGLQNIGTISSGIYLAFSLVFFIQMILGTLTILQMVRLRAAWHDSAQTMNTIKEYYVGYFKEKIDLGQALRWRAESLPKKYKAGSLSNLLAVEVAILCALTFGVGVYFFLWGIGWTSCLWVITPALTLLAFWGHLYLYKHQLTR